MLCNGDADELNAATSNQWQTLTDYKWNPKINTAAQQFKSDGKKRNTHRID